MVQELEREFIDYVRENDYDPVEVTLDKTLKKDLGQALNRTVGRGPPGAVL